MKTQRQRQLIKNIENFLFFPLKKRNWIYLKKYRKNYKYLDNAIKNFTSKQIIVSYSMPFECALFQRPQQMAIALSKCGFLYLY